MNRRKRRIDGEDRILKLAVSITLILFLAGTIVFVVRIINPRVNTTEGKKILKELSAADVTMINREIETMEDQEEAAELAWNNRPLKEKMSGSLVLGDGSVQGLIDFDIIAPENLSAEAGLLIASISPEKAAEIAQVVKDSGFGTVFLSYGMNDVAVQDGKVENFRDGYGKLLDAIQTGAPDSRIYVNGLALLPGEGSGEGMPSERETEMNRTLQQLCKERGIVYIDNKTDIRASTGEELRTHFENWGKRMAETAEL